MADTRPVVFCSWGFPEAGISLLREHFNVHVWDGPDGAPREVLLRELADGAAAVLALPPSDRLNPEAMAIAPNLKVISGFGVGFDYVDVAEATKRGIAVCNTPGTLTETTADQAWALMLGMARHVPKGDRYVRSGEWKKYEPALLLGTDIHGATLGVIGMGAIGTAVARRGKGFGMRILYSGRTRRPEAEAETGATYVPMDELLAQSDFVSINCALNAETRGLIGSRELGLMKRTAILVNSARGAIVKQAELAGALNSGTIAGAAIDVFEVEPIAPDDALLACYNAVFAPHLGSATFATRSKMSRLACENITAVLHGQRPPFLVNPDVWKH
ncbi:MAG: hypothetical protein RL022_525 [Chloroflexota bacterium]